MKNVRIIASQEQIETMDWLSEMLVFIIRSYLEQKNWDTLPKSALEDTALVVSWGPFYYLKPISNIIYA
jgi:hypothetical protein